MFLKPHSPVVVAAECSPKSVTHRGQSLFLGVATCVNLPSTAAKASLLLAATKERMAVSRRRMAARNIEKGFHLDVQRCSSCVHVASAVITVHEEPGKVRLFLFCTVMRGGDLPGTLAVRLENLRKVADLDL